MKTVINELSNTRLEQEIANKYWQRYEQVRQHYYRTGQMLDPGLNETGTLALLWGEFDARMAEGTIELDTDWTEDDNDI